MHRIVVLLVSMIGLVLAGPAPSFGARAISGSIGNVSAADGAALGAIGFRVYSATPGGETNTNDNTSACRNTRCLRSYSTNAQLQPGGYISQQEATQVYNGDVPDQPYYYLADGCMNNTAANHIGWFSVGGVIGNNSGIGNFLARGCPATTATNCFLRADDEIARTDLLHTYYGYGVAGDPHSIRHIGGLNPIPNVRVKIGGQAGCSPGGACLSWDDPESYSALMRGSNNAPPPPSPVQGVTLYRSDSHGLCVEPTGNDPSWFPIGQFPMGAGPTGTMVPLPDANTACSFFALRVRVTGPGGLPNTLETGCVGVSSQPVAVISTAVRIVRFSTTYAGHGVVTISWASGIEGDISGFYIARGSSASGPFARISPLVPARGDESRYSMVDHVGAGAGRVCYYQIQIQDRNGNVTSSSPTAVTIPSRTKTAGPAVR